jgi:hypothetical protein
MDSSPESLTTGEKVYCAAVLVCAGLLLVSLAMFHFVLIPDTDDPGVFYYIASVLWFLFATLAVTAALNLHQRSLMVVPTIVQCAALVLTVYLIPVAIWGAVLLRRRIRRGSYGQ